jgi:hypothetical protein
MDIKEEKKKWKWESMKIRKQQRIEYINIYTLYLRSPKLSPENLKKFEKLEEILVYEDILL